MLKRSGKATPNDQHEANAVPQQNDVRIASMGGLHAAPVGVSTRDDPHLEAERRRKFGVPPKDFDNCGSAEIPRLKSKFI